MFVVKQWAEQVFWEKAMTYASHLINRLPSSVTEGNTLMKMWSGKPATDYNMLRVFGFWLIIMLVIGSWNFEQERSYF